MRQRAARLFTAGRALAHLLAALLHRLHRLLYARPHTPDQTADLPRGGCRPLGQLADFIGYNREAPAMLARAGGLDSGIERQQVGLLGDLVDGLDDGSDSLALLSQLLDL